ncbi:MAG: TonB-dependent receptor [bacterium]
MKLVLCFLFVFSLILIESSFAHNKTIKGIVLVKNGKSEAVIGANVKLEGTVLGAVTNSEGKFIIKGVPDGKFVLTVSSIGMHTSKQELDIQHIEGDEIEMKFELEENPIKVSNVVVTATRSEKIYDETPVKVSTISQEDIRISSSNNLRESLQFQPGVRTEVNCQNCGFSQVRINGLDGKYSQILIDGKAIFSSLNGVYGLEQIPTNMIDKVEMVRGSGSSLYGGNAIAGVINVITKVPAFDTYDISWNNIMTDNKFPENILTLNSSITSDDQQIGLSIFGMKNNRHEYDANDDGFTEIGRMNLQTFGTKLYYKITSQSKITAEFHSIEHFIRGGNKLNIPEHETDITESAKNSTIIGQLNYEQFIDYTNKVSIYTSYQTTDRNSYYGANKDPNAYGRTDNNTLSSGINYSYWLDKFMGSHNLIFGYELNYDKMNDFAISYDRIIEQQTSSHGFYIQDDWIFNDYLNFLYGIRTDKHNLIDNPIFVPRASILIKPTGNLTLRATASTGYRAPQAFDEDLHITQVGGEGIVILVGDGLKPEYSQSVSASVDYSLKLFRLPLALSLEYFNTNLNDVFVLEDTGTDEKGNRLLVRENAESANVAGITYEIQSNYRDCYTMKFGLTMQKSLFSEGVEWSSGDIANGIKPQFSDKIFRAPDNYGYFLASFEPFENLSFDLSGYFTGFMFVPHYAGYIKNDKLEKTKSFFDMNAKIIYKFLKNPNVEASIGMQNLLNSYQSDFDKEVRRDAGYIYGPFRPRSIYFKIRFYY